MTSKKKTIQRQADNKVLALAKQQNYSPLISKIIANRISIDQLSANSDITHIAAPSLSQLPLPSLLADCEHAATRILDAVQKQQRIGLLTDYDVDGITSHAVLFFALRDYFKMSASLINSYIGHRLEDGYGVSRGLVDKILADENRPDVIITADCGSSDSEQIQRLAEAGIDVIVTDHHGIPDSGVPQAALAVINPQRNDCQYPDKSIAGCMVAFLLMCQVRASGINNGQLKGTPKLSRLLEFVSLGTVADAVTLASPVNRAVVNAGLSVMNQLQRPCWRAMQRLLDRELAFDVESLGFQIGPRINARGRMADPHAAKRYLLAEDDLHAESELRTLDADNQQRKSIEAEMLAVAISQIEQYSELPEALIVTDDSFHQGVQGIVASRLLDKYGRPAMVFSPAVGGMLTGSARSIDGLDIRKVLLEFNNAHPQLLQKFGGHAAAAGLTIKATDFAEVKQLLQQLIAKQTNQADLNPKIMVDDHWQAIVGDEAPSLDHYQQLQQLAPYGRGWESPAFSGEFVVLSHRWVGNPAVHLSLQLQLKNAKSTPVKAIWFKAVDNEEQCFSLAVNSALYCVFELSKNDYRGYTSVQLHILNATELADKSN